MQGSHMTLTVCIRGENSACVCALSVLCLVLCSIKSAMHKWTADDKRPLTFLQGSAVALCAGSINVLCTMPIWVVHTALISRSRLAQSAGRVRDEPAHWLTIAKQIFSTRGLAGFWSGTLPALMLTSNPIIYYAMFERLKRWRGVKSIVDGHDSVAPGATFLLSACAKVLAMIFTFPLMAIKSRMQAAAAKREHRGEKEPKARRGRRKRLRRDEMVFEVRAPQTLRDRLKAYLRAFLGLYKGFSYKIVASTFGAATHLVLNEQLLCFVLWLGKVVGRRTGMSQGRFAGSASITLFASIIFGLFISAQNA